jgi:hypothetical protein
MVQELDTMGANVEGLVREGINAIRSGRKDEGKTLLLKATELDQYNAEAWLWLSGTMESLEDQRTCLENVLAIDPDNLRAKQGLEYLAKQVFTPNSSPPPSPLINRATSTSVEWGTAAPGSPPPPAWAQTPTAKEPTGDDLDAWVSTLNLAPSPTAKPAAPPAPPSPSSTSNTSPFTGLEADDGFLSGSGPFDTSLPPLDLPNATSPLDDLRAATTNTDSSLRSPIPRDVPSFGFDDDDDETVIPARRPPEKPGASILFNQEHDADVTFQQEEEEASTMFTEIPGEIKATRIPGTRERAPLPLVAVAVLLVLLNIGAAALLAVGLLSA